METRDVDDPVAVYIREVSTIEPLTRDEETTLFRELGQGNADQRRGLIVAKLVENRLALVVAIAEKHSASDVPMLDLIQEGNIGLMNAVESFAETKASDFAGYAASCIEEAISTALGKAR